MDLKLQDMAEQLASESTQSRYEELRHNWEKEKRKTKPSLWSAMWSTFKCEFLIMGLYGLLSQVFFALSFFLMASVINNLIDLEGGSDSLHRGLWVSGGFALSLLGFSIFLHLNEFRSASLFIQIRKSMACLLYSKNLALHLHSISEVSEGKIINAVTSDLVVLDYGQYFISHLFYDPIAIPVYILMLYYLLGASVLVGITVPILFFLLSPLCGKCTNRLRDKAAADTDTRLKVLYDLLQGIRIVKAYGLEHKMIAQVKRLRNRESKLICCGTIIKSINVIGSNQASYLSAALIFLVKTVQGEEINAGAAFALLSTFSYFFDNIVCGVAGAILYVSEFRASLNRVRDILLLQQKETKLETTQIPQNQNVIIEYREAQASWTPQMISAHIQAHGIPEEEGSQTSKRMLQRNKSLVQFKLSDLSFTVLEGELVVVVGKVGSGKTTLISSLLGETYRGGRNFYVKEGLRLSYVEQDPFIISDTLQNNVLFGLKFDALKFQRVVELACLTEDLQELVKGEDTLIGERGANISGGQKARVSLARALYAEPDVYILDDPFSAVDPKVAAKLMENCVCGALQGKTRIVVTHRLNFVKQAQKILFMERGRLKFSGSFEDFSQREEDLAKISAEGEEGGAAQEERKEGKASSKQQEEHPKEGVQNLEMEEEQSGKLSCRNACDFTSYSCGCATLPIIFIVSLTPALVTLYISEWVKIWMGQDAAEKTNFYYPVIFTILALTLMCLAQLRGIVISVLTLSQSKRLHQHMVQRLLRGKIAFFDQNPVGRILNRLSKDVGAMDLVLPYLTDTFLYIYMKVLAVIVLVCILLPYMLIGLAFLIAFLTLIRLKAVSVTNAAMTHELMSRAPLSTQLAASLTGLQTIRAYNQQQFFLRKFFTNTEANGSSYYTFLALSRSLGFYLDFFSSVFSIIAVFLCFALRTQTNPLTFALAIQLLTDTLNNFQYGTRLSSELENYTNSFSRCLEYTRLESEAALILPSDSAYQLTQGKIEFKDVTMSYREDLPPALKDISLLIPPKTKVAIVGRTGAGKSSILQVLLRMRELSSGGIFIDSQDISKIGLHTLRSSISLLPQTPFLVSGTVRQNLDLFVQNQHSDEQLWDVLEMVHLAEHVRTFSDELNTPESSSLFSAGQKQLLSLARAILQNNKILVFDEPTANVDMATDRLIQELIRSRFEDHTVLTIAHRLDTVIDCDMVVMMDRGKCVELGLPFTLLVKDESDTVITAQTLFAETVKSAKGETEVLFSKARAHYFQKLN